MARTEMRPGAIFHMLAGEALEYEGETRAGPPDTITLPEQLGGDEVQILTAKVLEVCPKCGDTKNKPMLVLEKGINLSECMACGEFLWMG